MGTRILLALFAMLAASLPAFAQDKGEIFGTVVSIRGNILQIRPSLRPKLTRVSFGDQTEIVSYRRVEKDFLKPGIRVGMGGLYSEKGGYHPFFIEAAKEPIGDLKDKAEGIKAEPGGGWARASGTVKSVEPFVFTDDSGKEYTATLDQLRGVFEDYRADRNGILIGTRLRAVGPIAPDGVMQATSISPDKDYSATGMMFGEITGVKGRMLTVIPRYTNDPIAVTLAETSTLQREIKVDADSIGVGDTVTFWGQRAQETGKKNELHAIALLLGDGRYPASGDPEEGGVFLTGTLTSLDPVQLLLPDQTTLAVGIPAQMPIARLVPIKVDDLKPKSRAMLVLQRGNGDKFIATSVILDASPWVGYGG
jgi:hypothetical protein